MEIFGKLQNTFYISQFGYVAKRPLQSPALYRATLYLLSYGRNSVRIKRAIKFPSARGK
jgi:hypothetical protein